MVSQRCLLLLLLWAHESATESSEELREQLGALQRQYDALAAKYKRLHDENLEGAQLRRTRWKKALSVDRKDALARVAFNFPWLKGPDRAILLAHPDVSSASDAWEACDEVDMVLVHSQDMQNCLLVVESNNEVNSDRVHRYLRTEGEKHDFYPTAYLKDKPSKPGQRHTLTKHKEAQLYLAQIISALPHIEGQLSEVLADVDPSGDALIVMTVNDGQADLLLNFFCSAKRHNIDVRRHVIFASSAELAESLRGIGMTAYYNEVFGQFPTKAANAYGDRTFHKMMQLKVLAPYILSRMGYAVLFQDADLVWFRDPRKYFETADQNVDIFFMDDGARSRRFSPYFANSGFFYTKTGMNAVLFYWETLLQGLYFLRGVTSSHQEVMQRALSDLEGRIGMVTEILDIKEFVSGQQYHRNKAFMKRIKDGKDIPWVMHYCWTLSKVEKLEYMRLMDHWYISPAYDKKLDRAAMAYLQKNPHVRKAMLPASFLQSNLKWDVITSNRVKSWEHLCASD